MKFGPVDLKKTVVIDFETYYDDEFTLRKLRQEQYVTDKRFKVHGAGVALPNGKTDFLTGKDIPRWIKAHKDFTFANHKMHFDGLILAVHYAFIPSFYVDTLGLANAIFGPADVSGGNDLASVASRLGLRPKGQTLEDTKGKRDLTPQELKVLGIYAAGDAEIAHGVLHRLLPWLSRPEFELWLLDHTIRTYIEEPLPVRDDVARDAIAKVEKRVRDAVKGLPRTKFIHTWFKRRSKNKVAFLEKHEDTLTVDADILASNPKYGQSLLQTLKKYKVKIPMKMGKKGLIPALAKNDEGFIALKSSAVKAVRALVVARLAKRSGDTQIARLRGLLLAHAAGGFRIYLNYCGSHTGRWSGGSGLNPQNFPNPSRSTDDFEREVATLIRACVVPPKGRKFSATDAANIEARVVAWWAGQEDLVLAFGQGSDVYSDFATEAFKEEVRKPKKDDSAVKANRFKLLRAAGKEAVLGLGYSMGAPKMEMRMRSRPDVAPLFVSGDLDSKKCEAIVNQYRSKYQKIVALWGRAEAAFHKAVAGESRMVNGVLFAPMPKNFPGKHGSGVHVTLPSGRILVYPDVRIGQHDTKRGHRKQWVYGHGKGKKIYGGLLVENIVQAMSRDILAEGVWAMEHDGWKVKYHIHDSIVALPLAKDAQRCTDHCIAVLSETPAWGPGMMLGAEGAVEEIFA